MSTQSRDESYSQTSSGERLLPPPPAKRSQSAIAYLGLCSVVTIAGGVISWTDPLPHETGPVALIFSLVALSMLSVWHARRVSKRRAGGDDGQ